jgi:hypothetical protein
VRGVICVATVLTLSAQPVVREEQKVRVNGVEEVWRLVWKSPPKPVCAPGDEDSSTCPCYGFAFGEAGDLDLVRLRAGREVERLALTPLFEQTEHPGEGAALQHWLPPDRAVAVIMNFGDYDHDGSATEFLLQVSSVPCSHRYAVLIGVSAQNPKLHVFGAARDPQHPLMLQPHQWQALRESRTPVTVLDLACGDHASDEQIELYLQTTPRGIEGLRRRYACTSDDKRARLLSEDPL